MRVLQINSDLNSGSAGRIAEEIGLLLIKAGHESYIAFGRTENGSSSSAIKIGKKRDIILHGLKTRLFDEHGFGSKKATKLFVEEVNKIRPDIIHLHNIHGYYLNIRVLFNYLKINNLPVVWTFHDCWPFTGHCSHFQSVNCGKWEVECNSCPNLHGYPASWLTDNSRKNYEAKKEIFNGCRKMVLVSPSKWLASNLGKSFLAGQKIKVINNGVDLEKFKSGDYSDVLTKYRLNKKYILGIASTWTRKKGFEDFMMLRNLLAEDTEIVLAGLPGGKPDSLPRGIRGIPRTEDLNQLAALYSGAEIFVNPTYSDNFPLVNIEALACGTPVITYKTGGSAEAIDEKTGIGVDRGNIYGLASAIKTILQKGKNNFTYNCRYRAEKLYNNTDRYSEYLTLYDNITRN